MTEKDTGGLAFPHKRLYRDSQGIDHEVSEGGMSLRDWFAGQALTALISKAPFYDDEGQNGARLIDIDQFRLDIAASAYAYADAMIEARE